MDVFWLRIIQTVLHYFLHFVAPFFLARIFFTENWKKAFLIMIGTMAVDLDHLAATPIFDPDRCSIGFHFLHSYPAVIFYAGLLFVRIKLVRIIAVGLLFHMFTDSVDCVFSQTIKEMPGETALKENNGCDCNLMTSYLTGVRNSP